jgi:hypothetical protein
VRTGVTAAMVVALMACAGGAEAAKVRMFSYDPANAETRHAAGSLTFQFEQKLVFTTVMAVRSTMGHANAYVKPVDEKVLGHGGLSPLIGDNAPERDLYLVNPGAEGDALVAALCPGSKTGWLAFGRLKANRPLRVHVLGDGPDGAHLCRTLDFDFHGEWPMAQDLPKDTDREVKINKFPY